MSELVARQGIQTVARSASVFADADVTLNDWSILDAQGATAAAPFLIIVGSEAFVAIHPMDGAETTWDITALLFEAWDTDWNTTLESFLATRQALLDAFNADGGSDRALSSSGYYNLQEIRAGSPIAEYTDGDITYMFQEIVFVVEDHN